VFKTRKTLGVRIVLGIVVGLLGGSMLFYLIPGQGATDVAAADVVARIGGQNITITEVRQQLSRIAQNGVIPPALEPLYIRQVLNELIFQKELALAAQELGIQVSDRERADRIRQLIPTAFVGGNFVGNEQYAAQVLERANMGVPEFEYLVGQGLIEEKFRGLVTDGITVTPQEIEQEFRRRNDKIKLSYVVIRPEDLEDKINPRDADLSAYFEKNKTRYNVPERRTVRYALLDMDQLRSRISVSDGEIRSYYNERLNNYKIEDRARVSHILFKTMGKTDAEIEEIRKKAEDVLKRAKGGANFGDLARQYSEDTTSDKGGDLDWIVRGQTVPEFERMAFTLPNGTVSDLVKTQYGFHIIKVVDRQTARTQTLDEIRPQIVAALQQAKAEQQADTVSSQLAEEIRRAGRPPLEDLANKFNLTLGETQPLEAGQTILEVGNSPEIADTIFRLRVGDESAPIRTDRGYVVLLLKDIQASHPGAFEEVRDRVLADYRRDKAIEHAKTQAEELARRAKSGEDLDRGARTLGLTAQASELVARGDSLPDIGSVAQVQAAFKLSERQVGDPVPVGSNWMVYRLLQHQPPDLNMLPADRDSISQGLLQQKREVAFDAFRSALDARMKQEGKLQINSDNLRLLSPSGTPIL